MQLYDEIPYPLLTHSYTHPDRLAVVGRLMGLQSASPEACSVLELGCGSGANLIEMAELLPDSRFVGVDYSARQIEEGRAIVDELGLKNVDLRCEDVLETPDHAGDFDYIIAHGFYSWVPGPVREKALRLIKHSLTPHGIAFVSFNAYPGWHQLKALRDMMLYRTRDIADPVAQANAAREFIGLLAAAQTESSPFASFVKQYHSSFQGRGPVPETQFVATLLHDELAGVNDPFYFHEVVERAEAAGLQYLAEADLEGSTPVGVDANVVAGLAAFSTDSIDMEQYLDFIRNRGFRRTLFCHEEAPVARSLKSDRTAFAGLYVGSFATAERRKRGSDGKMVRFVTPDDVAYSTDQPVVQAAFRFLAKIHPAVVPFETLYAEAARAVHGTASPPPREADALASVLLRNFFYSRSLVELYVAPRHVENHVTVRPQATVFARWLAAQ
ncbi:MAG TPA: class I SAM-dependent methyltransferase, partial [Dehalococcoidia bacterium]|nr:class I SAM-dependent methyltransferase [Dehalococcoidia bacterium]